MSCGHGPAGGSVFLDRRPAVTDILTARINAARTRSTGRSSDSGTPRAPRLQDLPLPRAEAQRRLERPVVAALGVRSAPEPRRAGCRGAAFARLDGLRDARQDRLRRRARREARTHHASRHAAACARSAQPQSAPPGRRAFEGSLISFKIQLNSTTTIGSVGPVGTCARRARPPPPPAREPPPEDETPAPPRLHPSDLPGATHPHPVARTRWSVCWYTSSSCKPSSATSQGLFPGIVSSAKRRRSTGRRFGRKPSEHQSLATQERAQAGAGWGTAGWVGVGTERGAGGEAGAANRWSGGTTAREREKARRGARAGDAGVDEGVVWVRPRRVDLVH